MDGEQLCRSGPGGTERYQVKHKSAMSLVRKRTKSLLGCTRRSISSKWREIILPLHAALVRHTWMAMSGTDWAFYCDGDPPLEQKVVDSIL